MKILITGGTGFLGTRLVKKLLKKGHAVTVYAMSESEELKTTDAKQIIGNILDEKKLHHAFNGIDIVYHLAAILDESNPDMERINIEITETIIRQCKEKHIKHIIFPSSIGVLGYTKNPATEDMPYNPTTRYEKSKVECEKQIISSGLPYTIARITIIYGPNRFWKQIFSAAKKNYPIIGKGNNQWHLIYIDDVIDALTLMLKGKPKNQIYHIAAGDPHTYLETYKIICKILDLPEPKKHIPIFLVKTAAFLHETKCRLTGKRPNVTKMRSSIDRLIRNRIVNIEKAKKELGYNPKYKLETGIKKTHKSLEEQ